MKEEERKRTGKQIVNDMRKNIRSHSYLSNFLRTCLLSDLDTLEELLD